MPFATAQVCILLNYPMQLILLGKVLFKDVPGW